jgi:DNA invertase Pin-like site-specific DNA recombinase
MAEHVKVALYLRQSLDRTGEGLAVDRQRDACRKFAEARGWSIVDEYVDNSISATNGKRPEWTRMLADAGHGRFDVILAWALDRLTRSVKDTEQLVALSERTGVRVATVQGDIDLTTDQGRLVGRILSAVARGEIERKGDRQRLAHKQRAELGLPPIGPRALGYTVDGMELEPRAADYVRRGFETILTGGSLRSVVRLWNGAGLRSARGRPYRTDTVRDALLNPRYAGLRAVKGEVIGKGVWPAIVNEDTFYAVRGILGDPLRRTTPTTARRYLLSNLGRCGLCGGPVNAGGANRHGSRVYKCAKRTPNHLQRVADPIDDFVTDVVLERLSRPDLADLVAADRPDVSGLSFEAATLRTRRDQLAEDYAEGVLIRSQLLAGTRRIETRLAEIDAALADAARVTVLAAFIDRGDVRAVWDRLDLDQRRAVIDTLMAVTLHSPGQGARTFRPESIEITWRSQ